MEIQIPKSSDFIKPSDNLQDDITDIGLPKSSLNSVLKDFLSKNKFKIIYCFYFILFYLLLIKLN